MSCNLHNNHPLIGKKQNFIINRKVVTIHSEDRDINKHPNSNSFSITLPEPIKNVQSMRLLDSMFPTDLYTFSNNYENTKFKIGINSDINYNGPNNPIIMNSSTVYFENVYTIEISEGNYSYSELSLEIKNCLNNLPNVSGFEVTYSVPEQKFYFANSANLYFAFLFNEQPEYSTCNYLSTFSKLNKWGLGWNLGFKKKNYLPISHTDTTKGGKINSQQNEWFNAANSESQPIYWLKSELCSNIRSANLIYMEIEKYNSVDELIPNVENTSANYTHPNNCIVNNCNTVCNNGEINNQVSSNMPKSNYEQVFNSSSGKRTSNIKNVNECLNQSKQNDYGGKVNSVFAKIYVKGFNENVVNETIVDSEQGGHTYITTFNNQLEDKINKLNFKLRFHDGTPVDFNNKDFTFSLEFNQLKSDVLNDLQIRDVYNSYS